MDVSPSVSSATFILTLFPCVTATLSILFPVESWINNPFTCWFEVLMSFTSYPCEANSASTAVFAVASSTSPKFSVYAACNLSLPISSTCAIPWATLASAARFSIPFWPVSIVIDIPANIKSTIIVTTSAIKVIPLFPKLAFFAFITFLLYM